MMLSWGSTVVRLMDLGHFDGNTLEQVTTPNVVVIFADHQLTDIVERASFRTASATACKSI